MTSSSHETARERVLIVDDDDLIAGTLRQFLLARGCDIDAARDRGMAEQLLRCRPYAVILLDPYLTGEAHDAASVIAMVRGLQPEALIVLITAYSSGDLARIAGEHRATTIVSKPKPVPFLAHLVTSVLRQSRTRSGMEERPNSEVS